MITKILSTSHNAPCGNPLMHLFLVAPSIDSRVLKRYISSIFFAVIVTKQMLLLPP